MTKRIGVLAALAASVVAAALPMGSAAAPVQNHLSIETNAQWNHGFAGIDVQLHVSCDGGFSGFVNVQVSQSPPENQFPTMGGGGTSVLCDGRQHQVAVNVGGGGFDVGKAFAVATLCTPFGCPMATASKTINITF
ncbi:MAG: hypothetical protein ACRDN6_02695 [Gaiellaceae bacterium]